MSKEDKQLLFCLIVGAICAIIGLTAERVHYDLSKAPVQFNGKEK